MLFPSDRVGALRQLNEFIPSATRYGWQRNAVSSGHLQVSRLSPMIRHRLLTEDEAAAAVLAVHPLGKVEKFVQEIYWRRYWKAWLCLRPDVWEDYRVSLERLMLADGESILEKATAGKLGNLVIDHFARELVETGYMHNHARMWFAGWWIHEAHLPWELGAAFFFRHLLDGDPASNTLSWRWVAGLQTPGKTYLARRANLEKYLSKELLESLKEGLAEFEHPVARMPEHSSYRAITRSRLPDYPIDTALVTGLWIHEEDLTPESSPLAEEKFDAILVTGHGAGWNEYGYPAHKRAWLEAALADAAARGKEFWKSEVELEMTEHLSESLVNWGKKQGLTQIVALRPDVGPLGDFLETLITDLGIAGIRLALVDRARDVELRPLASAGFFKFWETMGKHHLLPASKSGPFKDEEMLPRQLPLI